MPAGMSGPVRDLIQREIEVVAQGHDDALFGQQHGEPRSDGLVEVEINKGERVVSGKYET